MSLRARQDEYEALQMQRARAAFRARLAREEAERARWRVVGMARLGSDAEPPEYHLTHWNTN
jgi:hypothetical protein